MKPTSAGCRASGATGTTTGEAEAEGASSSSGRGESKTAEGAKQPSDSTKIIKSALRFLKLRLDRVGRKLSELDFDNRALMGRLQFFHSENSKLHQALEKERAKVRNIPDRCSGAGPSSAQGSATSGSPTGASTSAGAIFSGGRGSPSGVANEPWPLCPSVPGRSSVLGNMMTPSTSSASLDAILGPRRQLRKMPHEPYPVIALASTVAPPVPPPPQLALPSPIPVALPLHTFGPPQPSNTSFQDGSEEPLFLFTDLFENTSDESVNNNVSSTIQGPSLVSSQRTVQNASTETVPSTSTAARAFSSNTTVASDVPSTSKDQQLPDQPDKQDHRDGQDQQHLQEQHHLVPLQDQRVSSTCSDPTSELKATGSRSPPHVGPDPYEPKYSMSSSSLD